MLRKGVVEVHYNIAIVGAGPAGIFAAYELIKQNQNIKIVMIEQGKDIYSRKCPLSSGKIKQCVHCDPCAIMRGFGGAGAFSDGKYNFTTKFGGWLNDYLPDHKVMDLIDYVDNINYQFMPEQVIQSEFSRDEKYFPEKHTTKESKIKTEALKYDLHLLDASVRHLGTENNLKILKNIYEFLKDKIEMKFETTVERIGHNTTYDLETNKGTITCDYLIAAPGRAGAEWFSKQCSYMGLQQINNQVDIGVRVELPADTWKHITDEVYEAKLQYRTKKYNDLVRTFCMNPNGFVVEENVDGIVTVNGHSFDNSILGSENTNFALLVSNTFTEPFNQPHQYGKRIASFSNMLGGGIIVQRFGDLINGRRTNERRLMKSFVKPTLTATPGDLSLVLPKRHLDNIIEMIIALDHVAPGTANDDTLLYGVEVKFYSARLKLTEELETEKTNMFAIGDGSGITRSLSQAAASGIYVARCITKRIRLN